MFYNENASESIVADDRTQAGDLYIATGEDTMEDLRYWTYGMRGNFIGHE